MAFPKTSLALFFVAFTIFATAQEPIPEPEVEPGVMGDTEMMIGNVALFMGFSPDGKVAAFETTWQEYQTEADGKQKVYIVDVEKNDWVTGPISVQPGGSTKEIAAKYGIAEKHPGELILGIENPETKFEIGGKQCGLKLLQTPAPDGKNKLFELDLVCGKTIQVLQKDKSLPKSRGAVDKYVLTYAYVFGSRIAVLMEYKTALFKTNDGPTRKVGVMMVTGVVR